MRLVSWLALALVACPPPGDTDMVDTDPVDPGACPFDEAEGPEAALPLGPEGLTGFLCPVGDQDWARYEHPGGLLQITLGIEGTVAPVQPTWTVWTADAQTAIASPEPEEAANAGSPLSMWHSAPAGPLLVQVRDQGNDGSDTRRAWSLGITSRADPDTHEPNDDIPVALPEGTVTGSIAYRGDIDRFSVSADTNQLLRLRLQVPAGGYDPALTIIDSEGVELLVLSNPAGRREATDLSWTLAVEQAGTLGLAMADDDNREHDPDTAWTLTWSIGDDPDISEPNDHPAQASSIGSATCGASWSDVGTHDGYIATSGDVDWIEVPLSCGRGLLEAELSFDEGASALPPDFVPSLRLVREVASQSCSRDQDCVALDRTCGGPLDCEGIGNTCLGSGQCSGAAVCLPTGTCGANLLIERSDDDPATLRFSAPLPDLETAWLAVSEQGGDQLAPDTPYALSVRTRTDPDGFEPNDIYTAGPPSSANASRHIRRAVEIPVRDCRPLEEPGGTDMTDDTDVPDPRIVECCDSPDRFTTGHIASAYDQDWFKYQHPCPGGDCMVRVHVQHDAGPVDVFAQIYRGSNLWFDGVLGTRDVPSQSARTVRFGGLDAEDQCFYAFNKHSGSPFWYHIAVRDTVFRGSSDPTGGSWDWSADQEYRVCVEVLADGCYEPPCKEFTDGCGTP